MDTFGFPVDDMVKFIMAALTLKGVHMHNPQAERIQIYFFLCSALLFMILCV
jgi:hypothetical protein